MYVRANNIRIIIHTYIRITMYDIIKNIIICRINVGVYIKLLV